MIVGIHVEEKIGEHIAKDWLQEMHSDLTFKVDKEVEAIKDLPSMFSYIKETASILVYSTNHTTFRHRLLLAFEVQSVGHQWSDKGNCKHNPTIEIRRSSCKYFTVFACMHCKSRWDNFMLY